MKILFFDIETTGLNHWEHGIHQISGIIDIDGKEVERFDFKVRPVQTAKIDYQALSVSGVSHSDIMAYPDAMSIKRKIDDILADYVNKYDRKDKFFLAGYNNAHFDNAFLRKFFTDNNDNFFGSYFWSSSLDVMVLAAKKLASQRSEMPDFKLRTVAEKMGIAIEENRLHDSSYDIEITRKIYYLL